MVEYQQYRVGDHSRCLERAQGTIAPVGTDLARVRDIIERRALHWPHISAQAARLGLLALDCPHEHLNYRCRSCGDESLQEFTCPLCHQDSYTYCLDCGVEWC